MLSLGATLRQCLLRAQGRVSLPRSRDILHSHLSQIAGVSNRSSSNSNRDLLHEPELAHLMLPVRDVCPTISI